MGKRLQDFDGETQAAPQITFRNFLLNIVHCFFYESRYGISLQGLLDMVAISTVMTKEVLRVCRKLGDKKTPDLDGIGQTHLWHCLKHVWWKEFSLSYDNNKGLCCYLKQLLLKFSIYTRVAITVYGMC